MVSKITKRKDGLFQASYYVNTSEFGKKRQFVYGKTKQEAKEKRDLAISNNLLGNPLVASNLTVTTYLQKWVKEAKRLQPTTRSNYTGVIKKHIIPYIGSKRLSTLDTQTIQQLINQLTKDGRSIRTTQIVRNLLSRALREAEVRNLVKPNLVKNVQLETYRPKERTVWTKEECDVFLKAIKGHKYELFFTLYVTYGLRRGEAIPITWDDIDFDQEIIRINKQYTIAGNEPILTTPKAGSTRALPMLPHIRSLLEKLNTSPNKNSLVVSDNDKLINPRSINYEFSRIIKENNLPVVVLHSLRHFAATMFKQCNFTIKEAQEILGHKNPLTTLQFYQHSSVEEKREALQKYTKTMNF
ncbi:site-specific integrase [Candidatus Saccharibacteria bacterium]|nr:site-specific integrase [Candidatus Saccharibacteria bacterium]